MWSEVKWNEKKNIKLILYTQTAVSTNSRFLQAAAQHIRH
jgi:hypothetical protein